MCKNGPWAVFIFLAFNMKLRGEHIESGVMPCGIKNVVPCCYKVAKRPANCGAEFDNLGSALLLGQGHSDWDMTTGMHKQGLVCLKDRMSYEETAQLTGIALSSLESAWSRPSGFSRTP